MLSRLFAVCAIIVLCGTSSLATFANNVAIDSENGVSENNAAQYQTLQHKNETWHGSTFWSGPEWTRVGKDWQHPGTNTPSVRRFVAPLDGRVTIAGRVFKSDTSEKGDGVRLIIRHGNRKVWREEIVSSDSKGIEPHLILDVKRGDSIRFIVHKLGHISHDTTHWNPLITYKNGMRFQASEAFDAKQQGHGNWHYEMQSEAPRLSFAEMIEADWLEQDKLTAAFSDNGSCKDSFQAAWEIAVRSHIAKTRLLLTDLREHGAADFLAAEAQKLDAIEQSCNTTSNDKPSPCEIYLQLRSLKREIILANPLMDFGPLLFCKRVPSSYSHLVMQYYGWRARPGGGLFVLENPGRSLACHDILKGKLSGGSVLEPRLSYDARRIVFSYVEHAGVDRTGKPFDQYKVINDADDGFYHIYEVNVDGSGLRQLTSGTYDDMMPTYLPDGGIAFCSTRRRGYARCFGWRFSRRWHVYTLHRMDADGKNLRTLSMHDTNEWFPTVDNSGKILYSRWDYIDRDAVTHQNLWSSRPDGTNPIAVWGNGSPKPHCTFQIQPIPGSNKIVFTAAPHHSISAGPIAMVDPTVSDNSLDAITLVTPEIPFPEAETRDIREYYAAPWPLSEKYFLVAYCPTPLVWEPGANDPAGLGLYVIDIFGNRELIYRDAEIGCTNPCPLTPRPTPPVLASDLPNDAPQSGEMILADVYAGLGDIPRGSIEKLRIVQIFPKATHLADRPPVGVAREENARAILGTVPVEPDGSARFNVPAMTPLLFQALDKDGFAYQTMRTLTYVQPGERVSCVGCHENRMTAPVRADVAALRRPPSKIEPGPLDGRPFSYVQVVQPILDKHCVSCHGDKNPGGGMNLTGTPEGHFSKSYNSLCIGKNPNSTWESRSTKPDLLSLVPRFTMRNQLQITPPGGHYGALGSRLMKMLREGHENVALSDEEMRRLAAWIDMNAVFYGVYKPDQQKRELSGEVFPLPELQ